MRLDKYLSEHFFSSRTKAVRAIENGLVLLNGKRAKPSDTVKDTDVVTLIEVEENYVSEGGYKLAKAKKEFLVDFSGKVYVDIGASTGGFTDVLLQNGAQFVYAVDVGQSQLDCKISNDSRVCVMDNTNARDLKVSDFSKEIDGVVTDVSFISLTYILPVISQILKKDGEVFALIKPQFECGAKALDKHGIVKNSKDRLSAIQKIYDFSCSCNLAPQNICVAPEKTRKNKEYVIYLKKDGEVCPLDKILKVEK